MNWDLFLKNLGTLNQNLFATSDKKEEVYNILVEHNTKAEIDFLTRLTNRKVNKNINNKKRLDNYQKNNFINSRPESITGSFNMQLSETSESKPSTKGKEIQKFTEAKNAINFEVGTPSMGVPALFLFN